MSNAGFQIGVRLLGLYFLVEGLASIVPEGIRYVATLWVPSPLIQPDVALFMLAQTGWYAVAGAVLLGWSWLIPATEAGQARSGTCAFGVPEASILVRLIGIFFIMKVIAEIAAKYSFMVATVGVWWFVSVQLAIYALTAAISVYLLVAGNRIAVWLAR